MTTPVIITPIFRGYYVNLIEPRKAALKSDKMFFSMFMALETDSKECRLFLKRLSALVSAASTIKWGKPRSIQNMKDAPVIDGSTWGKGDDDDDDDDDGDDDDKVSQFDGMTMFKMKNVFKPQTINSQGMLLSTKEQVYSGAWYRAEVGVYCWEYENRKGFNLDLKSVLKTRDDDRIGGGSNANVAFRDYLEEGEDLGEDEDDEDEQPNPKRKAKSPKAMAKKKKRSSLLDDGDDEPPF